MQRFTEVLIVVITFFSFNAHAQFSKGIRMTGADLGSGFLNSNKSDYTYPPPTTGYTSDKTSYGINLTPKIGWFVSDNMVIGPLITLTSNHEKTVNGTVDNTFSKNTYKTFGIGIGGFARNYFKSSGKLIPFGQFSLGLSLGSSANKGFTYYSAGYKETYDGKSSGDFYADAGLSFGFTKMLNDHAGLDIYAGYKYSYNKYDYETTTLRDTDLDGNTDETLTQSQTVKSTGNGLIIGVGFQIFFDRKK